MKLEFTSEGRVAAWTLFLTAAENLFFFRGALARSVRRCAWLGIARARIRFLWFFARASDSSFQDQRCMPVSNNINKT